MSQLETAATLDQQPVVSTISRGLVGIHASHFGRGPTKAKTIWRETVVVCILEEIFTRAEQTLVAGGQFEQVRANRLCFQDTVEPLMIGVVEAATGHSVRAFFSQVNAEGIASETFVLEPTLDSSGPGVRQ